MIQAGVHTFAFQSTETILGRAVETAFKDPHSFVPERWTTRPDMILDKRAFAPFGLGGWERLESLTSFGEC